MQLLLEVPDDDIDAFRRKAGLPLAKVVSVIKGGLAMTLASFPGATLTEIQSGRVALCTRDQEGQLTEVTE